MIGHSPAHLRRSIIQSGMAIMLAAGVSAWLFTDTWTRHSAGGLEDGQTIRFAHFGNYRDYEFWRESIRQFEELHPEVMVKQEYVVGLASHYNTKLRQQMLTDSLPDVALIQWDAFTELGSAFTDVSAWTKDTDSTPPSYQAELDPIGLSAFRLNGVQRGLPVSGGDLLIFLNLDCLTRANKQKKSDQVPPVDWSMADFRAMAKHLTCDFDGDGVTDQFGFWLPRWVYYLPFLWSFGADLTDQSARNWTLTGNRAEAALGFYRALIEEDRSCPRDREVPQLYQDTAFLTGRVAMCVNGPWLLPFLQETNLVDRVVVLAIPRGVGGRVTRLTWDGVVVRKGLPLLRHQHAVEFVRYILSDGVQNRIATLGRALPARRASLPVFTRTGRLNLRQPFVAAMSYGRLQPRFVGFTSVDQAINRMMYRLTTAESSVSVAGQLSNLAHDPAIISIFQLVP